MSAAATIPHHADPCGGLWGLASRLPCLGTLAIFLIKMNRMQKKGHTDLDEPPPPPPLVGLTPLALGTLPSSLSNLGDFRSSL